MAEEFKPIETQAELDAIIKESVEEAVKQYENYVSKEDYDRKVEELQSQINYNDNYISEIDKENRGYKTEISKIRIAAEFGIPIEISGKLSGETEEEIRADAEKLIGFLKKSEPVAPLASSETIGKDTAYQKLLNNLK